MTRSGPSEPGVACDWRRNAGDLRIQLALLLFRLARRLRTSPTPGVRHLGRLVCGVYLVVVEWTWGIEIPWSTRIGPGLRIYHGTGIVIHGETVLGAGVTLRQGVCIGARKAPGPAPTVGDGVSFGAGAIVIGGVAVGAGATVGAGAVVLHSVPDGATAVGNPARVLNRPVA